MLGGKATGPWPLSYACDMPFQDRGQVRNARSYCSPLEPSPRPEIRRRASHR
jgi:hypothetical protein